MTDTTVQVIAVAALVALPQTIASLAAYRAAKSANKKADEVKKKTDENTEVTKATLATVDRVETQTNGHLSVMTLNVQNLESKLETALKLNADLQGSNASIVEMMKKLLEAEARDKKEIVQAIETNGTKSPDGGVKQLDTIQKTTTEIKTVADASHRILDDIVSERDG